VAFFCWVVKSVATSATVAEVAVNFHRYQFGRQRNTPSIDALLARSARKSNPNQIAVRAVLASGFVLDYWRLHHAISMFHMLFYCVRKYVYEEYRE
jgi:hypothetical protein